MNLYKVFLICFVIFIVTALLLLQYNKETYKNDIKIDELRRRVGKVFPIVSNLEIYVGEKSYTINKEKVFLCLKDEKGDYYDENMLVYVLLHELAHVMNDEVGHGQKFQQIFDEILKEAEMNGIYDSNKPLIQNYCEY